MAWVGDESIFVCLQTASEHFDTWLTKVKSLMSNFVSHKRNAKQTQTIHEYYEGDGIETGTVLFLFLLVLKCL